MRSGQAWVWLKRGVKIQNILPRYLTSGGANAICLYKYLRKVLTISSDILLGGDKSFIVVILVGTQAFGDLSCPCRQPVTFSEG